MYPQQSKCDRPLIHIVYTLSNPNVKNNTLKHLMLICIKFLSQSVELFFSFYDAWQRNWRVPGKTTDPSEGTYKTNLITL